MRECTDGGPGAIRTPDPFVRSEVLYPTELRARKHNCTMSEKLRNPRGLENAALHFPELWPADRATNLSEAEFMQ